MKTNTMTAQEKAMAIYTEAGIACNISEPRPAVRDDWPCIEYDMTFKRGNQSFKTQYRLGVGHVKYIQSKGLFLMNDEASMLNSKIAKPCANYLDKDLEASLASKLARAQKVQPSPVEVLAKACRESIEAMETTWEDYAGNFGMNPDSIKGFKIWQDCMTQYPRLRLLLSAEQIKTLSEIAMEF